MNGTATLAGRMVLISGSATLLHKKIESEVVQKLLLDIMKASVDVSTSCIHNLSKGNQKKLYRLLQTWQAEFIKTQPTVISIVLIMLFLSTDLFEIAREMSDPRKAKKLENILDCVYSLNTIYDPDGEFFEGLLPDVSRLNDLFISLFNDN